MSAVSDDGFPEDGSHLWLNKEEARAVKALQKLAKSWPRSLSLVAGTTGLTVRKAHEGQALDENFTVAEIAQIPAASAHAVRKTSTECAQES